MHSHVLHPNYAFYPDGVQMRIDELGSLYIHNYNRVIQTVTLLTAGTYPW